MVIDRKILVSEQKLNNPGAPWVHRCGLGESHKPFLLFLSAERDGCIELHNLFSSK